MTPSASAAANHPPCVFQIRQPLGLPPWVNKPENDEPSILEQVELAAIGLHNITSEVTPSPTWRMAVARKMAYSTHHCLV